MKAHLRALILIQAKPSEPHFIVDVFTNELQVYWTSPGGHYEGVAIYFNNTDIEVGNSGTYSFTGLAPYTKYEVEMYSWITNVEGEVERSKSSPGTYKTLPGPPPLLNADSSLTNIAESSSKTITIVLSPNTFSEENGPIEYYGIYIAIGGSDLYPTLTTINNCKSVTVVSECVTLWTDGQGNLIQDNVQKMITEVNRQSGSIKFIIGDGSVTLSPCNHTYVNYPLQPDTGYRVAVAAKTGNDQMTTTNWSLIIVTDPQSSGSNAGLIAGVVCGAILLLLVIIAGIYYYRRHEKKGITERNLPFPNLNISTEDNRNRSIPMSKFKTKFKLSSQMDLQSEFRKLPKPAKSSLTADQNQDRNRHSDFVPYDSNRVKLVPIMEKSACDYINASYVAGYTSSKEYIATQGSLANTMNDFWRMIWEQECSYIAMIGELVVKGEVACSKYWPSENGSIASDDLSISLVSETVERWTKRVIKLESKRKVRLIKQFQFPEWLDEGYQKEYLKSLVDFATFIRSELKKDANPGPVVVHCSNGSGRTGTFISLDRLLQEMQEKSSVNIFETVQQLRQDRMVMVENFSQYLVLYKSVEYAVKCNMYDDVIFDNKYENTMLSNNQDVVYQTIPELYEEYERIEG
ncbi:receptor-type tyrosine-protein phosphatase beta-like [Clavelina lepadiformis]|uniref:receptor-type tyrosine-protein phosphatase beta-like n=1 Tax=Clavelina lepadiformis TaxID=159417 RepID=UPI0040435597